MFSNNEVNPLDCIKTVNFTYREIWTLNLLVNSKLKELNFLHNNSCYADPVYLERLRLLSSRLIFLIDSFECDSDLPF